MSVHAFVDKYRYKIPPAISYTLSIKLDIEKHICDSI